MYTLTALNMNYVNDNVQQKTFVNNMIDLQVRLMNYLVKVQQSLYRP